VKLSCGEMWRFWYGNESASPND